MAPVVLGLQQSSAVETIVCVTAQHRRMLDQVLDVFGIRPEHDLDIMRSNQTVGGITTAVLNSLSELLGQVRPDLVVVHGDTTTAFAAALASFYARIPVGHVEAGLRTGNLEAPWPEEFNRCAVDLVADKLWAPTERAAQALRSSGAADERIVVTGNTVIDALEMACRKLDEDPALRAAARKAMPTLDPDKRMILVTGHRRESFDGGLARVCRALNTLAKRPDVEILWPVHRNPTVVDTVRVELAERKNVHLVEPADYFSFIEMMRRSYIIITDSGGIQEEAPTLGKPVLVTRGETERPEAMLAGAAMLVGTQTDAIVTEAERLLDSAEAYDAMARVENPFGDGRASARIVESILGG